MLYILNVTEQILKTFLDGFINLLNIDNPLLNVGLALIAMHVGVWMIRIFKKRR